MTVKVFFAWYDFWIGFFYDQKKRILYICPFPCVVIKIERNQSDGEKTVEAKWKIDLSAGRPVLTYEDCSVIQDEQAEYIMNLIQNDYRS
jgi:hypothetical protein